MSIKLIAVDIDGTLVNSQKEITPEVFSAIQDAKEAGVKVVIATGRPIAGVAKLLDDLQLRDEGDYVVTFNGALVQETATGHEIISESLTYEDYLDMEFLSRKLGVHMHAITKDGIYTANRNIGKYTVHESTLVSMPIFYRTPEEMAELQARIEAGNRELAEFEAQQDHYVEEHLEPVEVEGPSSNEEDTNKESVLIL